MSVQKTSSKKRARLLSLLVNGRLSQDSVESFGLKKAKKTMSLFETSGLVANGRITAQILEAVTSFFGDTIVANAQNRVEGSRKAASDIAVNFVEHNASRNVNAHTLYTVKAAAKSLNEIYAALTSRIEALEHAAVIKTAKAKAAEEKVEAGKGVQSTFKVSKALQIFCALKPVVVPVETAEEKSIEAPSFKKVLKRLTVGKANKIIRNALRGSSKKAIKKALAKWRKSSNLPMLLLSLDECLEKSQYKRLEKAFR